MYKFGAYYVNNNFKKVSAIIVINIFLILALSPSINCDEINNPDIPNSSSFEEIELDLLRGEHYLYIDAVENVSSFNVIYSFPPEYGYQIPIMMEIFNDSTANILNYTIENDSKEPNIQVNFSIGPMEKDSQVFIHFNYWVLVKNNDYSNLPRYVKIPKAKTIPPEITKWLSSTKTVQKNKILIKLKARELKILTTNLLNLAFRIAKFCRWHRYLVFLSQSALGTFRSQDALTTLLRNGECPGRSHLACALFRANGVPARVVLENRNYSFWYELHYAMEYYCPGQGWILTEVHRGITPDEPKKSIILRICHPEDENNTQSDFLYPKMKGIERWFWIDNQNIKPFYDIDVKNGSKMTMFREKEMSTDVISGEEAQSITREVFHLYQNYLGLYLTGENIGHYQNATSYQFQAISEIKIGNVLTYISLMNMAIEEYSQIVI